MIYTFKLLYFKSSGKYYSEGDFEVDGEQPLFIIYRNLKHRFELGFRPGLIDGHSGYTVVVVDSDHPDFYPILFKDIA